MNKKQVLIGGLLGVIFFGAGFIFGQENGRSLPMTSKFYSQNKVIATVGESKIKEKELKQRMNTLFFINAKRELSKDEIKAYEESFIDYLTTTEVLYLEGEKNKISVTDEEVKTQYENLMTSLSQAFNLSEDDILHKLNIPKTDIENSLKKELVATKYMEQISDVSEEEAKKYYEQNKDEFLMVRASHILIENVSTHSESEENTSDNQIHEVTDEEKQENKIKAENILEQAKAGVDFSELAKKYSDDFSGQNGGDLGFFMKGQMVKPFEDAVYSLNVGEIYDKVVETDFGYHIIKKTDEKYEEFDTIKEDLIYRLSYEKQDKKLDELIAEYNVKTK